MAMAATVFLKVATLLMLADIAASEEVTVEFDSDVKEFQPGGKPALLSCTVSGPFNKATDDIVITKENIRGEQTTIATRKGKTPGAPNSINFVGWFLSIKSLHVIAFNLSRNDWGTYSCKVIRPDASADSLQLLAYDSLKIDVPYPPLGRPTCKITPNLTLYEGDEVTLQCKSDSGNPSASLEWFQSSGSALPKTEVKTSLGVITGTVPFNLDLDHNDAIFSCIRINNDLSSSNVSTCSLGPLTVFNKTETGLSMKQVGVIAGVSIIPLILIVLCIVVVVMLVRSKRKKLTNDYETPVEDANGNQDILLGGFPENKNKSDIGNNGGEPKTVANEKPPNPAAIYASVQKNKSNGEPIPVAASRSSKVYPNPPAYPRPPAIRECMKVNEQYANSTVGVNSQPEANGSNGVYQSTPFSQITPSALKAARNSINDKSVYSNTLDVGPANNVNNDQVSSEYANADKLGKPKVPAPTQSPPAPPSSSETETNEKPFNTTPGLEYAELDTVKPSTNTARKSTHLNEPVIYAAVKS